MQENEVYNPFGYRGEYTDSESGLVYLRARMYDPQTGRFINEDPAHDGLNWYVYCGNNPVNLTDPWGLAPGWNESNDHWFALRYEIEDAGGSVSWNGNTRTATASVYGVSVDFKIGNVGVELRNGVTYVRADTFYSGVVNSATEMGFLGTHSVALGNYHTSTIMFVSKDSDYHGTTNFKDNVRWGDVQFATLGAGDGNGKLQSDINRTKDKNLDIKVSMQWLYSGIGTTKNLFTAESHYRTNYNNLNYDLFPTPGRTKWYGKGYNSNSFTAGLLNSVGFSPQTPSYKVPGWNKPLPASYFGL